MQLLHSGIGELCIVQAQHSPHVSAEAIEKGAAIDVLTEKGNAKMVLVSDILRGEKKEGFSLNNLRTQFAAYLQRRAVYNQTVRELSALSNRELTDLGISRADIRYLANEAANGR